MTLICVHAGAGANPPISSEQLQQIVALATDALALETRVMVRGGVSVDI